MSRKDCNIVPNDTTLQYYFYFMQERMNIFWRKCQKPDAYGWTDDPILKKYKFTNVYRATDRVSQYLIREVIYKNLDCFDAEDVLLRILVFKVFNKIETWEYLNHVLPEPITIKSFDPHQMAMLLSQRQKNFPIFNNAYMMTGSHRDYDAWDTKHEKWLQMLEKEILEQGRVARILNAKSLQEVYDILNECAFIGGFLAYQYAIDLNYSPFLNFDENSFVKAGIGAIRGIKKCFHLYGSEYEDAIRYIQQNQDELRARYGYTDFKPIPGHAPTLIDLQNCFCETDKYLRVKMPELVVDNVRIKQTYSCHPERIYYMFPSQWNVKEDLIYEPHRKYSLFDCYDTE